MEKVKRYFPRFSLSLSLTIIYVISGVLWIFLSDNLLHLIIPADELTRFQTLKGWFFVLVTAIILFFLVNGYARRIREAEEKFRQTVEGVKDYAIYLLNTEGGIVSWNKGAEKLLGYSTEEIIGLNHSIFFTEQDLKEQLPKKQLDIAAREGRCITEGERLRKDGSIFYASVTISALRDDKGELTGFLKLALDITEKKKTQEMLLENREQMRRLMAHLETIREEERLTISREIHDELGQILTSFKIDLSLLSRDGIADENRVSKMKSKIDTTINTVRKISSGLRPTEIDLLGLETTIEAEISALRENTSMDLQFKSNLAGKKINNKISISIYRIFQEAVTNILRHSGANNVIVNLYLDPDNNLCLEVADNGKGFNPNTVSDISFGVIGMKERAAIMGGDLKIVSAPGNGCCIQLTVPKSNLFS